MKIHLKEFDDKKFQLLESRFPWFTREVHSFAMYRWAGYSVSLVRGRQHIIPARNLEFSLIKDHSGYFIENGYGRIFGPYPFKQHLEGVLIYLENQDLIEI